MMEVMAVLAEPSGAPKSERQRVVYTPTKAWVKGYLKSRLAVRRPARLQWHWEAWFCQCHRRVMVRRNIPLKGQRRGWEGNTRIRMKNWLPY